MDITMGVPRIKEIINAAKTIRTPIITAYLDNPNPTAISAKIIKGRIEKTLLGDVTKSINEVYTPAGCFLEIRLDHDAIDKMKLELSVSEVRNAILKHPKIKLKP